MSLPHQLVPASRGSPGSTHWPGQCSPLCSVSLSPLDLGSSGQLWPCTLGSLISPSLPQSQAQRPFCSVRVKGARTEHPSGSRSGAQ